MRKVLMVLVLGVWVSNVYAQTIKGKVVDEKSQSKKKKKIPSEKRNI